ncbi:hypothetical protein SS50377_24039 [Spironucleus salmonicida]|uniref:Exosome RNA binding protein RRP4 N-terminal domain-containing protein n=1 Tax=Spironucleus salmonicida TaxID=348837 RepID=V6LR42_9EUKA|nr:hypothetical protein SS50377_24039 [Spironucleus salmonicida]|eukprot:EST47070.1 hypothetical protein SS50377_12881 [Spironucleus salmonicida]
MLLFPGQVISHDNSLQSGDNTYWQDNQLLAQVIGKLEINDNKAKVVPLNSLAQPRNGDIAIATVQFITQQKSLLNIVSINGQRCNFNGVLRIQDAKQQRLSVNQIIQCQVLQMQSGIINVSTLGDDMGIVKV